MTVLEADTFGLGELSDAFDAVESAVAGIFPAAVGHDGVVVDALGVDVDLAGVDAVCEFETQGLVLGVHGSGETVFGGVCDLDAKSAAAEGAKWLP